MIITHGEYAINMNAQPKQKMLSYIIAMVIEECIRNEIEDELSNIYLCLTLEIKHNPNAI